MKKVYVKIVRLQFSLISASGYKLLMRTLCSNKYQQAELGKLSPFLKNTQKSRHLTQSVVVGVGCHYETHYPDFNFDCAFTHVGYSSFLEAECRFSS